MQRKVNASDIQKMKVLARGFSNRHTFQVPAIRMVSAFFTVMDYIQRGYTRRPRVCWVGMDIASHRIVVVVSYQDDNENEK